MRPLPLAPPAGNELPGGSVDMTVSFSGLPIYSSTSDLCTKTTCPVRNLRLKPHTVYSCMPDCRRWEESTTAKEGPQHGAWCTG